MTIEEKQARKSSRHNWLWPILIFIGLLISLYVFYDFNDITSLFANSSKQQVVNAEKKFDFPQPEMFPRGYAERCLAEFLYAWHKRNFRKMADHTNFSWRSNESNPTEKLYAFFSTYKLLFYEVLHVSKSSDETAIPGVRDITIKINYEKNGCTKEVIGTVQVIYKSTSHDISELFRWGVNPVSVLLLTN